MAEVKFNPKIDKYFVVQGLMINEKNEVRVATRKYNVIDLRTISLEQAIELYNEKVPYLIPTEEGIKYLKETREASQTRIAESEAALRSSEEATTETKKK